jgi:hypothetical protein
MMPLTFMKYALTRFDASSIEADDLKDESPADAVEVSPNDSREDDLTWFSLSLDRRAPGRPSDELARLSLTTTESGSAANADFERWM